MRGNQDRLFPLVLDSSAAARVLHHFEFRADLIFIDAAHGYEDVTRDIDNYYPLLSGRGVIFGDDYQHEPLAQAVHDAANRLAVSVLVIGRKWFFVTDPLMQSLISLKHVQVRRSREGWVHP